MNISEIVFITNKEYIERQLLNDIVKGRSLHKKTIGSEMLN